MYFLRGSLPWQGLKAATNKQKYEKIGEKKQTTQIKELCEGYPGWLPSVTVPSFGLTNSSEEFGIYLNYVRKLGFEETPDYDFLRELFAKVMKNNNEVDDGVFDWNMLNGASEYAPASLSAHQPARWKRLGSLDGASLNARSTGCELMAYRLNNLRSRMYRQLSLRIVDEIWTDHAMPSGEGRPKAIHKLFHLPLHSFAMGRSSAGSQTRLRPALVASLLARLHPYLRLPRSTFPSQRLRTEQATTVFRNTRMPMPLQARIMEMTKRTPTNPMVVPLLWYRMLVLHHLQSVMFVHEETKSVYHKETSIMTRTAMPRSPSQVSGESLHVDAVETPIPVQLRLCCLCHERTLSHVAGHFFAIKF